MRYYGNKFTNVETFPCKDIFSNEEITVVMAVLGETLNLFEDRPNRGSIALHGQVKGATDWCILQMDLGEGSYDKEVSDTQKCSTAQLAEESINSVLNWPEKAAYNYEAKALCFGELPTGVYLDGAKRALVLNTAFGRFIMSAYLAVEKKGKTFHELLELQNESIVVMKGMAMTLTKMGKGDYVLQKSMEKLMGNLACLESIADEYWERGDDDDDDDEIDGDTRRDLKTRALAALFASVGDEGDMLNPLRLRSLIRDTDYLKRLAGNYDDEVMDEMICDLDDFANMLANLESKEMSSALQEHQTAYDDEELQLLVYKFMERMHCAEWLVRYEVRRSFGRGVAGMQEWRNWRAKNRTMPYFYLR